MMVKKKFIEWGLLAPLPPLLLFIIFIALYPMLSSIALLQMFLNLAATASLLLGIVLAVIFVIIVSIDILQSKKILFDKLFLLVVLFVLGYIAAVGYHFLEVRKRSDPV